MFTLKIAKLETLCRALQEERKLLYDKIKDVRMQTITTLESAKDAHEQDISEITEPEPIHNPAITADMENLWKEQVRLQEFAASLLASIADDVAKKNCDTDKESSEPTSEPIKSTAVHLDSRPEEQCVDEHIKEVVTEASKLVTTIAEPVQTEKKLSNFKIESSGEITQINPKTETPNKELTVGANLLKPVMQSKPKKEVKFEVKTETVESEVSMEGSVEKSIVMAEDPKSMPAKEASSTTELTTISEVEHSTMEPEKAVAAAFTITKAKEAKPQSSKAQEAKSKCSKSLTKTQSSTKKKASAKNVKKS